MSREEFLKTAIKEKGFNLKDFAKNIEMPYTTLLSIINNSVGGASVDNIIKICKGLDLDIEELSPQRLDEALTKKSKTYELSEDEDELLQNYRKLKREHQWYIKGKIDTYLEEYGEEFPEYMHNSSKGTA